MKQERRPRPSPETTIPDMTRRFLDGSLEDRLALWQQIEFVKLFPRITETLLKTDNTEEERRIFFNSSLTAITTIPWSAKMGETSIPGQVNKFFPDENIKTESDSLFRTDIASIILLGMSLPEKSQAMTDILTSAKQFANNTISFKNHLLQLILQRNATQQWITNNNLDKAAGDSWGRQIAELYVNLPPHSNIQREQFVFPTGMKGDLINFYITDAVIVFTEYVLLVTNTIALSDLPRDSMPMLSEFIKLINNAHPQSETARIIYNKLRNTYETLTDPKTRQREPLPSDPIPPTTFQFLDTAPTNTLRLL